MIRVGILGVAHVHTPSYVHALKSQAAAELIGHWDRDGERSAEFAQQFQSQSFASVESLLGACDAVVICAENLFHADLLERALAQRKPALCEKPLAASTQELERIHKLVASGGAFVMTAFPCPYSPVFQKLTQRVRNGEIGKVLAINATNRGKCPFGWFVDPSLSGGGCMIDHTVHVADLIYRLLGESPTKVSAQTGSNMYGEEWEDTAHLTLDYPSGVFATLDSSWSRSKNYHTWGDVNITVVGESGVIETSLFNQGITVTRDSSQLIGTGSNLDNLMVSEFISKIQNSATSVDTASFGIKASQVALAAYQSVESGQPVSLA